MPTTGRHPRRHRLLPAVAGATALLALALAVGCGGGDDDGEAGTDPTAGDDTTTTTTPTTAPPTPEEEAKAAYARFSDTVYDLLTANPDPDSPTLVAVAAEPVLGTLRDSLTTLRAENQIVERGAHTGHAVLGVTVSGNTAELQICSVADDRTIDRNNGSLVSDGRSARFVEVTLARGRDEIWRVTELATTQIFDGELTCG